MTTTVTTKLEAIKRSQIREHSGKIGKNLATQLANVRAGEMKQKTYSGYDLGRNVTYKTGGTKQFYGPVVKYI